MVSIRSHGNLSRYNTQSETTFIKKNNKLIIYDYLDLYMVLPAFIDMVFSKEYRLRFVNDSSRVRILMDILQLFIEYHDGKV
jgi:hypothetical protein